ncbi:hypothetical protein AB0A76_28790 [Streptomyces exfoliatus]|uniref:Regulatory protein n=1 Tax=Streptomyces exfoliatus TaxID=1905 RepID=A0ABV3D3S5_STREX
MALRVAGNWLTVRSGWPVDHLIRRLADEERRLGALAAGDVRVEAAFELSYRQLTGQAARMLRFLSLVPGPDMTATYGAALTTTSVFEAEDVMEELVEAGLLQATFTGRYQLHDLLRIFARARLAREDEPAEREAAEDRLRTWLLETTAVAGRWYKPTYGAPPCPPGRAWSPWRPLNRLGPGWRPRHPPGSPPWETRPVGVSTPGSWRPPKPWTGTAAWRSTGNTGPRSSVCRAKPPPHSTTGYLQAIHLNYYSLVLSLNKQRHREAIQRAEEALAHARAVQDTTQQAWALVYAVFPHRHLSEAKTGLDKARVGIELFEAIGDHDGWIEAVGLYGASLRDLGRAEEALVQHGRMVAFLDTSDCPLTGRTADTYRAYAGDALGSDCAALRRWREAADHLRGALLRMRRLDIRHTEGSTLLHLSEGPDRTGRNRRGPLLPPPPPHPGRQGRQQRPEDRAETPGDAPRRLSDTAAATRPGSDARECGVSFESSGRIALSRAAGTIIGS